MNTAPTARDPEPFTLTADDGVRLAGSRWPARLPRAVLLLVHGYAEHAARHARLATAAADAGFDVWSFDQRNHGNSPGRVRGSVPGFAASLADVAALQRAAADAVGALPRFLFGHSMGGAISLTRALDHPTEYEGLCLSSPFLKDGANRPAFLQPLARLAARVAPGAPVTKLAADGISRLPDEVRRYEQDPLIYHGGVRADAAVAMLDGGISLLRRAQALAVPTLVVHGSADPVASVDGSRALAAASSQVELVEFQGGRHELHHDGLADEVVSTVVGWLVSRLG